MICEGQGFESFGAKRRLSAEDFLRYVGLRDGRCAPPELRPLEPNEAYLRFKDCYGIELSRQQERAAQVVDGATLLVAVPGSGKTTVLVARLGYLALERGIAPESIVCITHTKAAAEEMRARFSRRFGGPTSPEGLPSAPSTSWRRTSTRTRAEGKEQSRGESIPLPSVASSSTPAGVRGAGT